MDEQNYLENQAVTSEAPIVKKKHPRLMLILGGVIALAAVAVLAVLLLGKGSKYNKAMKLIQAGDHEAAYEMLSALGDYKDTKKHLAKFRYLPVKTSVSINGEETQTISISYNEDGLPTQQTTSLADEEYVAKFTYDSNGNITKAVITDSIGEHIQEYTYDKNGNLIKEKDTCNGDERITEYTYDESGKRIKEVFLGNDTTSTKEYTYNESGKLIGKTEKSTYDYVYYKHTTESIYAYTYDEKGDLIRESMTDYDYGFSFGNEVVTITSAETVYTYTYDASGNPIRKVASTTYDGYSDQPFNIIKSETVYECTYDEKGHPIREVVSETYVYGTGDESENTTTPETEGDNPNSGTIIPFPKPIDIKTITEYTYDTKGNPIKTVITIDRTYDNGSVGSEETVSKTDYKLVYVAFEESIEKDREILNNWYKTLR